MTYIDDKLLEGIDRASDAVLKQSEKWSLGQKLAASAICFVAGVALISGVGLIRVIGGVGVVLYGIAFLTFTRRSLECQSLTIKDERGKPRISLSGDHGIIFVDDSLHGKIILALDAAGRPIVNLRDEKEQITAAVSENGAALVLAAADSNEPDLALYRRRAVIGSRQDHAVSIAGDADRASVFLTHRDVIRAGLSGSLSSSSFSVMNTGGAHITLSASDTGTLGMLVTSENGHQTATLTSSREGARIRFFGESEIEVASCPDEKALRGYAQLVAQNLVKPGADHPSGAT